MQGYSEAVMWRHILLLDHMMMMIKLDKMCTLGKLENV